MVKYSRWLLCCAGLLVSSSAFSASCNLNKAFDINSTPEDRAYDEALCAQRALTQSVDLFKVALQKSNQGDVAATCKAMNDSLSTLEKYKNGDWRSAYEDIADKIDTNYFEISSEFVKTTCPEKLALYLRRAAEGSAWAMYNLGVVYEEGKEAPLDMAKSIEWYKKSADLNYISSITNLAVIYAKGTGGVAIDQEAATALYLKAAKLDDNNSQYYVAYRYLHGMGVAQDNAEAAKWYKKCADNDDEDCKKALNEMYENGQAKKPLFSLW